MMKWAAAVLALSATLAPLLDAFSAPVRNSVVPRRPTSVLNVATGKDEGGIEELPGKHFGKFSVRPILQAVNLLTKSHEWTMKRASDLESGVYKAHPGWKTVLVTDHAAADYILKAPASEFDRDDSNGFLSVSLYYKELLDGVPPTLVTQEKGTADKPGTHAASRALIQKAMDIRGQMPFVDACNEVCVSGPPSLRDKPKMNLAHGLCEAGAYVMFQWLFGVEGIQGDEHHKWVNSLFGTRADTPVAHVVISRLKPKPSKDMKEYSKSLLERIRGSEYYPRYVNAVKDDGMAESDVAPSLLFAAGFNPIGPCFSIGKPAVAKLNQMPDLRQRLVDELEDVNDINKLDELPLFNAFFYESMRHFGRPTRAARMAVGDTQVPMSNGKFMQIPGGSTVQVVNSAMRHDPTVFVDPESFSPDRFLQDPSLIAKVFAFSGPKKSGSSPFQCAAEDNGAARKLWKAAVAPFVRDMDASIEPKKYKIKMDEPESTKPDELTWIRGS